MLQEERAFEAHKKFLAAVEDFPKLSLPHFNLGFTFDKSEDAQKAESEYLAAIQLATDSVSVFSANFNLAILKTKEKKINEALERYQAALAVVPDSKEVKTNIELLFKSQQGGGGEGDQDSKDDQQGKKNQKPKDGQPKDEKEKKEPPPDAPRVNRRKMPRPFKSEDLSKQDMERILDELKRQENQIRGRMNQERKSEEKPVEKDW